jgi:hypothetical protein
MLRSLRPRVSVNQSNVSDHPFTNRETRIKRREERNMFRRRLLPLAWALSFVGYAGLLILGAYLLLYGEWLYQYAGLFIALAVLPFVLTLVSWLRGHNSNRLEEP